MSTEHHKTGPGEIRIPLHEDVSFEAKDVRVTPILKFLIWLGIGTILSFVVAAVVYSGLTNYWKSTYAQPMPSQVNMEATMPPEPRLQGMPGHLLDPQADWRKMVEEGTAANDSFGWVDKSNGIAQIPVKDAMELIVEKGLPAVPAPLAEKK